MFVNELKLVSVEVTVDFRERYSAACDVFVLLYR